MELKFGLLSFNESNLRFAGCAIPEASFDKLDLLMICTQESTAFSDRSFQNHIECATKHFCLIARNQLLLPGKFLLKHVGAKNVQSSLYVRKDLFRVCPSLNE